MVGPRYLRNFPSPSWDDEQPLVKVSLRDHKQYHPQHAPKIRLFTPPPIIADSSSTRALSNPPKAVSKAFPSSALFPIPITSPSTGAKLRTNTKFRPYVRPPAPSQSSSPCAPRAPA
ncbi:hypothetical protein BDK51DRAFT_50727 [Blyttiomyces helicus]|uniref:Uncharacterized protein n=1 Tax=Blyttiomyces helicus TaxID=388810 RepID=A0A4V1IRW3_9FUNG|nr:hypothetical protein BDK51DRAFT_50727 [Blyttiomyces helicus]|eukprot:RKO91457.1 hypothetical protein BDK51DRAFT_50727 [Blyttiomyces helicus]